MEPVTSATMNHAIWDSVINFFDHPFFIIVGGITTIFMMAGFLWVIWLVITGVFPVWYRLGMGLSKSKIAIFANEEFGSLKGMITAAKIFKGKNIIQVHKNDIEAAMDSNIYLVHWKEWEKEIDKIIKIKKPSIALIVYAPPNEGRIEDKNALEIINTSRNSVLVNFRGRLLNDIVTALITISYEK